MKQSDFDVFVNSIDTNGEAILQFTSLQKVKDYMTFQEYLQGAGDVGIPYNIISRNCLHIATSVLSRMNENWSKDHVGVAPPAWGVITGEVPLDGDNCSEGCHALIICFCEDGPYLGGAQDRQVMNQSRVKEIKSIEYLKMGE